MFLDHDGVDAFGVFERKETKASRAAGRRITHNGTFADLTKLRKVAFERICSNHQDSNS